LFGYWGSFNINILEYATISDLTRWAIYPLASSLFFVLVGVVLSELTAGEKIDNLEVSDSTLRKVRKYGRFVASIYILSLILALAFVPPPRNYFIGIALGTPIVAVFLGRLEITKELVPHDRVRSIITFLLILCPALAFYYGKVSAQEIKEEHAGLAIDIERSEIALIGDEVFPAMHLGFVAGSHFIYEVKTSNIVIINDDKITNLVFTIRSKN
jgi:hypothetical protein